MAIEEEETIDETNRRYIAKVIDKSNGSKIPLSVNGLNNQIKTQRLSYWIKT